MENDPNKTPLENASAEAVHKTKNAQAAIETAREVQMQEIVEKTAIKTKESLLEGLKEVFGESDSKDPERMSILIRRVPILCTNVNQMHSDIADIKDNIKWAVRVILGAIVVGIIALVFK